jgi:2-hydroxy-6-oxonona-2,4-dienedioate hydrolase
VDSRITAARDAESAFWRENGLTVTERFVEIDKPRLRVRMLECGNRSGPPIVFVQGGLGEAWGWASLLAGLTDFRCITLDRPGGGLSDPVDFLRVDLRTLACDTFRAVLDAASVQRAPFVANSMGGWWTFQCAMAAPERVSRMVMIGCPALLLDTSAPLPMRLIGVPWLGRALARTMVPKSPDAARGLPQFLGHPAEVGQQWSRARIETVFRFGNLPEFPKAWHALLRRFTTPGGARRGMNITRDELCKVVQPTLFLWGTNDPFGGLDVGRAAAAMMPNARLEVVGVGHLPWWDDAEASANHIRGFVSASDSGGVSLTASATAS